MGEAAAPGGPWGMPGCGLGQGGSRGAGSEGQPLPRASALHGPPAAPGNPQTGALGEGRPRLAARGGCTPAAAALISGSLLPCLAPAARFWVKEAPSSPTVLVSQSLCPLRFCPEIPRDPLGSRSWEASFPLHASAILLPSRRVAEDSKAILHTPTILPPTRSLRPDSCGKNPTARFLQSDAARRSSSPCEL